jgi:hypothetical protein
MGDWENGRLGEKEINGRSEECRISIYLGNKYLSLLPYTNQPS